MSDVPFAQCGPYSRSPCSTPCCRSESLQLGECARREAVREGDAVQREPLGRRVLCHHNGRGIRRNDKAGRYELGQPVERTRRVKDRPKHLLQIVVLDSIVNLVLQCWEAVAFGREEEPRHPAAFAVVDARNLPGGLPVTEVVPVVVQGPAVKKLSSRPAPAAASPPRCLFTPSRRLQS